MCTRFIAPLPHTRRRNAGGTAITYDNNGNMLNDTDGHKFIYDAWNRLVEVTDSEGTTIALYEYDGLGRRVQEWFLNDVDIDPKADLYYSNQWQILDTFNENDNSNVRNIWSPTYVNALVVRERDTDLDGIYEERLYATYDANYSVTAALSSSSYGTDTVQERMSYTSYGVVTFMDASWGEQLDSLAMRTLYQGMHYNVSFNSYDSEQRIYSPSLDRWLTADPTGYAGSGSDLYESDADNPINGEDPSGLITVTFSPSGNRRTGETSSEFYASWNFRLDKPAKEDGYIVQKVVYMQDARAADGSRIDALSYTKTYYEAWFVKADGKCNMSIGEYAKAKWSLPYTDQASEPNLDAPEGTITQETEIRWYSKLTTKELGDGQTPLDPSKPITFDINRRPLNVLLPDKNTKFGYDHQNDESGSLPSSDIEPDWWKNKGSEDGEKTAGRYVLLQWAPSGKGPHAFKPLTTNPDLHLPATNPSTTKP